MQGTANGKSEKGPYWDVDRNFGNASLPGYSIPIQHQQIMEYPDFHRSHDDLVFHPESDDSKERFCYPQQKDKCD